jgi:hypothetical protein
MNLIQLSSDLDSIDNPLLYFNNSNFLSYFTLIMLNSLMLPIYIYIHTYHSRFIPEGDRDISDIPPEHPHFYQNDLAMKITGDVAGSKPTL